MAETVGRKYPVVMRMEGMFPQDISGYERHRTRKGSASATSTGRARV